jgi:hypothetical protein
MQGVKVTKKQAARLMKKNRKQRAREQYPENADVLESILNRLDVLEKAVGAMQKDRQGLETRINNLADRIIKAEIRIYGKK